MNVSLVGYRGTGKTTVARLLAERLGWQWIDLDDEVELHAGKSIARIFAEEGESTFRELEATVVRQVAERQNWVIATGGGVVLRSDNRETLNRIGPVIWLMARPETIEQRLSLDPTTTSRRPDLTSVGGLAEIGQVLKERVSLYEKIADLRVAVDDQSPRQVTDTIHTWLEENRWAD